MSQADWARVDRILHVCITLKIVSRVEPFLISLFLFAEDDCEYIKVTTEEDSRVSSGLYVKTDERVPAAPNSSVWKHPDENEYIFNTGSTKGWRIGWKSYDYRNDESSSDSENEEYSGDYGDDESSGDDGNDYDYNYYFSDEKFYYKGEFCILP